MALTQTKRAIGTFPTRHEAEQALHELKRSGFPMEKVSVIARHSDRAEGTASTVVNEHVGNKADDGAKAGVVSGGALGGLTGLLVGLGILAIPGIGPVMLAGAGATVLATALSGTMIGAAAGGLLGGLIGLGIPEKDAKLYSDRVSRGDYLVMVEGTDTDIHHAEQVLKRHTIQDWGIYNTTDAAHPRTVEQALPVVPMEATSVNQPINTIPAPAQMSMDEQEIRLYEERLRVEKARQKTGEVTIIKNVETETASVTVPIEKERIVVERVVPPEAGKPVAPREADFQEGEVMRIEVYEETPDIQKQTVVREEVNLRKEIDRKVVNAEETLRREELDVQVQGEPRVDRSVDLPPDRV
jgi:uncharacterized protein (TIGR02271 family)